jgi:N-acetylglutamate synthase-like GNAT family acetyltransferase
MSNNITYRSPKSDYDFENYYNLRWRILRKPWNQPKGSELNESDSEAFHIMAEDKNKVVGIGCIHKLDKNVGRIRFMAVDNKYQRRGIAKQMMQILEDHAREQGWIKVRLWAREIAWDFYLKLGYVVIADGELLFGVIKHKIMEKEL